MSLVFVETLMRLLELHISIACAANIQCSRESFETFNLPKSWEHHDLQYTSMLQVGVNRKPAPLQYSGWQNQEKIASANSSIQPSKLNTLQESTTNLVNSSSRTLRQGKKICACNSTDSSSQKFGETPLQNCTCPLDAIKKTIKARAHDLEDIIAEEYVRLHTENGDILLGLLACLVYFVLPWHLGKWGTAAPPEQDGLSLAGFNFFPAMHSMRYCAMVALLLRQRWFKAHSNASEFFLLLSGFVLHCAETCREPPTQTQTSLRERVAEVYKRIFPRRLARLYPLYALGVIVNILQEEGESRCSPIKSLLLYEAWGFGTAIAERDDSGAWHLSTSFCGDSEGTWFVSIIFGCYLLFPVLTTPLRYLQLHALSNLWACCILLVVIPRALGTPAHAPNVWWSDIFQTQQQDVGLFNLRFSQRSLIHQLAYFFSGTILARAWIVVHFPATNLSTAGPQKTETASAIARVMRVVSRYGCMLGCLTLTAWYLVCMHYPHATQNPFHNRLSDPIYFARLASEVWRILAQCCLIVGAAGECNVAASPKVDAVFWVLCLPSLAWMGELALPMYLSSPWICNFAQKVCILSGIPSVARCSQMAAQLVAANIGALILYRSMDALPAKKYSLDA